MVDSSKSNFLSAEVFVEVELYTQKKKWGKGEAQKVGCQRNSERIIRRIAGKLYSLLLMKVILLQKDNFKTFLQNQSLHITSECNFSRVYCYDHQIRKKNTASTIWVHVIGPLLAV